MSMNQETSRTTQTEARATLYEAIVEAAAELKDATGPARAEGLK
ncbi:hypothetical protein [Streptomyces sp. NPDC001781]